MAPVGIILERIWPPGQTPAGWLSHLGGWPNLPGQVPWPRIRLPDGSEAALDFLAQIDLASLPEVHERGLLPSHGTLYFFAIGETAAPFEEIGPGAFRVIHLPDSAAGITPRAPPAETGWGQADLDHTRSEAGMLRDTDGPRGALYPYCPVRPRPATAADDADPEDRPRANRFDYGRDLPLRVADALLHINFVRNAFFENIIPLNDYLDHLEANAVRAAKAASTPRKGGPPRPPPAWVTHVLSDPGLTVFAADYERWRSQAARTWHELAELGRSTVLTAAQRVRVSELCAQASTLRQRVTPYRLHLPMASNFAVIGLADLLRHDPDLARRCPEEVAAAAPSGAHPHRMLGSGRRVQGGTMTGAEPILLLQLESDTSGPRFMWWDCGNLTFWISTRDAAARRFDAVVAAIEGH